MQTTNTNLPSSENNDNGNLNEQENVVEMEDSIDTNDVEESEVTSEPEPEDFQTAEDLANLSAAYDKVDYLLDIIEKRNDELSSRMKEILEDGKKIALEALESDTNKLKV